MAIIKDTQYFYGTTSNEYIDVRLKVDITADTTTNKSSYTAFLQYKRNNTGFTTSGTGVFSLKYPGLDSAKYTKYVTITENEWVTAAQGYTVTSKHDSNGNLKDATISGGGSIPDTTLTSSSVSGTVTFPTLNKNSIIDSLTCSTSYFTGTLTYKYTPMLATNYTRCNISLKLEDEYVAVKTINLGQKEDVQQTATVTLSASELSTIYNALPSATKGTLRFTLRTYTDSDYTTQVNSAAPYKDLVLSIPNTTDTQPTVTMTLAPVNDETSLGTLYVKNKSKVKATFTNGAGKYGATIASYKLNVASKEYGSPYTSDYLATTGNITVKGTVTDSRGFSRSYSQTISVINYTTPTIDLVSCSTSYFTGTLSFKYTPANNTFYSRCVAALNINGTLTAVKTFSLGVKSAGQKTETFTFSASEIDTIYKKYPSATKGTLRFTFRTYTDAEYTKSVGDATYQEITLSIPNDDTTKPTATLTVTPVTSLPSAFSSLYIKEKAKATATLASGAGKYGATIKSYTVAIGAKSGDSPLTSEYFTTAGTVTVTGTITDSRGFSRTYSQTIDVIDYASPQILPVSTESAVIISRCNSAGAIDENGTYLLIAAKRGYSKVVSDGEQKNFCVMQYRYKVDGGAYSSWSEILARGASSDEVILKPVSGVTLEATRTYTVQVRVVDDIGETVTTSTILSTQKIFMHRAGSINALGIGKYAETENTVDIAEDMTVIFRGDVQFKGEEWVSLPLGTNVVASSVNSGRWGGSGVFYRVCAGGKHVYVAFNVSFTTSSSTVRAESYTIPYPPTYDVYALCPVGFSDGSRGIATVSVSPKGRVNIYAVHKLPGATLSTGETVTWIDGYIDFWT